MRRRVGRAWPFCSRLGARTHRRRLNVLRLSQCKAHSAQPHALRQNRARRQDPVVCAAFALGVAGTSVCPPNFFRLDTAEACNNAAAVSGTTYGGTVMLPGLPAGCHWVTLGTSTVYFNALTTGAANVFAQPLCAGTAQSRASAGL
jgi:hypothetical protein